MVYGLDDDIDKGLFLATTLTRIIAHYSECDNPEGGMWDLELITAVITHFL